MKKTQTKKKISTLKSKSIKNNKSLGIIAICIGVFCVLIITFFVYTYFDSQNNTEISKNNVKGATSTKLMPAPRLISFEKGKNYAKFKWSYEFVSHYGIDTYSGNTYISYNEADESKCIREPYYVTYYTSCSYTVSGLKSNTSYQVYIYGINDSGNTATNSLNLSFWTKKWWQW